MIKIKNFEDKIQALKIPGNVAAVSDNDFFIIYRVLFNPEVTLNKIRARRDDLALFFGVPVEIETDAGAVLIKAQKQKRDVVGLYDFTEKLAAGFSDYEIPLIIGETENGEKLFYDLVKTPHILAAGATGSGKSVFLNNCIISTFYSGNTNLLLIDTKRVEFSIYDGIPHLITPVCYDSKSAGKALKALCDVMENRYKTLEKVGCKNILEYRKHGGNLNYVCVVIDELADLVLSSRKIENYLIKLAQLGRAAGIHLILATQRPDATVISGLIRANIPTRVCFAVQKATDSRIILDISGGEKLRGAGDGLFVPIGSKNAIRFQAPYISTDGLQKAVDMARRVNG